jgi:23S rRNA (guanosine2251-2'-O)-methyltransferase
MPDSIIYGVRPILELLNHTPKRIKVIYTDNLGATARKGEVLKLAHSHGITVQKTSRDELDKLSGSTNHQSLLAQIEPSKPLELKGLITSIADKEHSLIVALDSIHDPHNVGAILRAAECFGADGVIYSRNRGADITPTVRKVSAGASELLSLVAVSNLATALKTLKDHGYWIVTSALSPEATPLNSFDFPNKTVLVLGSEGDGVKDLTKKLSDFEVAIELFGKIDSLNVSQAAAILLSSYRRTRQSR